MYYKTNIHEAIVFSIQTHEVHQNQKRKGTGVSYITHPLTVGMILARTGASDDVVTAGILHDTIEDSTPEHKVTESMLSALFGEGVARLVASLSEEDKRLPWTERKAAALVKVQTFSHEQLLVKSADIVSNASDLIESYQCEGDAIFTHFNASKAEMLIHQRTLIRTILACWPETPLSKDLKEIDVALGEIEVGTFRT